MLSQGYIVRGKINLLSKGGICMKHKLQISVSKKPKNGGIVSYRRVSVRERLLRLLLGNPIKLTIVVPGDTVDSLSIKEVGGGQLEQN